MSEAGKERTPIDLAEQCKEVLDWHRTGLMAGDKLRAVADSLHEHIHDHQRLRIAEDKTASEAMQYVIDRASSPAQGDQKIDDGAVPHRESFWLLEKVGHGEYAFYATQRGSYVYSTTDDVWKAGRFRDERDAHEAWRMLDKAERERWKPIEHVFINKHHDAMKSEDKHHSQSSAEIAHGSYQEAVADLMSENGRLCKERNAALARVERLTDALRKIASEECFGSSAPLVATAALVLDQQPIAHTTEDSR